MQKQFQDIFARDFDLEESRWRGVFDFVSRDSDTLYVTIGDSWTYGWRLDQHQRVSQCYGGIISHKFGWDFLNLSLPAANNLWMLQKYQQLCEHADELKYQRIKIFITLTEVGREFWTDFDHDPELHQLYSTCETAKDVALALSTYCAQHFLKTKHERIDLCLGMNYVSNTYPKELQQLQLPCTWLEVLLNQQLTTPCYVVGSWVIPKYRNLEQCNQINVNNLLQEIQQLVDTAQQRLDLIYNSGYNYQEGYGHPNDKGHALWADYIISRSLNNECTTFSDINGN
jgi:lysophospholipase L1-like esterase